MWGARKQKEYDDDSMNKKERWDGKEHKGIWGISHMKFICQRAQIIKEQFVTTYLAHFISIVQVRLLS